MSNENYESIFLKIVKNPKQMNEGQWRSNCPFHNETTPGNPSFHFNVENGLYQCKSCGAKGNIWQFIEHFQIPNEYTKSLGSNKSITKEARNFHYNILNNHCELLQCWNEETVNKLLLSISLSK